MIKFASAMMAASTFAIIAMTPAPAAAQGTTGPTPTSAGGNCPSGYSKGTSSGRRAGLGETNLNLCYPQGSNAPAVFQRRSNSDPCPAGMRPDSGGSPWCTSRPETSSPSVDYIAARSGTGNLLTKPSKGNRCPTGWASTRDLTQCFTMVENAPTARLSGGKPCAPGAFNDWGVWCTSNYAKTTKEQAYDALTVDFNRLYLRGGPADMKPVLSADATAHYGPKTYADSSTSASVSSSDSSKPTEQTAQCASESGSANGAAIGGALGGDAGAALGGMLGGLGKKKKKAGC